MDKQHFLVVAIGTSAGGLKALAEFFEGIPKDTQSAFIVVMHLLRDHASRLDSLIRKQATLPVVRVEKDTVIKPGNIYVMAEDSYLTIQDGKLKPQERDENLINKSIDMFFGSLAKDCGKRSVGIVLSGVGDDGLEGVKKIEERGGIVFAQDPNSTKFNGMPLSIIRLNHPDVIATPAEIARFLISYEQSFARDIKISG